MSINDVFFDPNAVSDPLQYLEGAPGALFVPLIGLSCERNDVRVAGFRVLKIHPLAWRMIERNWIVDLYQDLYAANPRFYCVIPVESNTAMTEDLNRFLEATLAPLNQLILALRLAVPGFVVNLDHCTPVMRVGGINTRAVGRERYRLYGLAFDKDIELPEKVRQFGEHGKLYPERTITASHRGLQLRDAAISLVEQRFRICTEYAACPPDVTLDIVIRNVERGHDLFLTTREQLVSLLTAVEAAYGEFGRQGEIVRLISQAYQIYQPQSRRIDTAIQDLIRPVRNAIAHGADYRRDLDYGGAAELLRDILRVGLPALLRLATPAGTDARTLAGKADHQARFPPPVTAFQRLLQRSAAGDMSAREALAQLAA